jgi:hypothetical protein
MSLDIKFVDNDWKNKNSHGFDRCLKCGKSLKNTTLVYMCNKCWNCEYDDNIYFELFNKYKCDLGEEYTTYDDEKIIRKKIGVYFY